MSLEYRVLHETSSGAPEASGPDHATAQPRLWRDVQILVPLGIGLCISLCYAFLVTTFFNSDDYLRWGLHFMNWWKGVEPEPVLRTPGYPLFLAVMWKLGLDQTGVRIVQSLLVAATGLLVSYLADDLAGRRAARWSAWVFAAYLPFEFFAAVGLTEVTSTFLIVVATVATVIARRNTPWWGWWVSLASFCAIASVIVRPAQVFLLPVIAIGLLICAGSARRVLATLAILAAAALVIFGPWVGRNMALNGKPQVFGSGGTYPFAIGVHLPADLSIGEMSAYHRSAAFYEGTEPGHFGPVQASQLHPLSTLASDLEHHTGEYLWARTVAQFQMWPWPSTPRVQLGMNSVIPYPLIMALHILVFAFGLVGLITLRRSFIGLLGLGMVLFTVLPYLIVFTSPRYTIEISPFLVMGTGILLAARVPESRLARATRSSLHQVVALRHG